MGQAELHSGESSSEVDGDALNAAARAERLCELQARNAERVAETGDDYQSLLVKIRAAYRAAALS